MAEAMRIVRAVGGLIQVLGYAVTSVNKFREGKEGEGVANFASALRTGAKHWGDIQYSFDLVRSSVASLPQPSIHFAIASAKSGTHPGYFTGRWRSSYPGRVEIILHEYDTNVLYLYGQKVSGHGYNEYQGAIDLERSLLVWTGMNSQNQELIIIGNPDREGHNIQCHVWARDSATNQIKVIDEFSLARE